MSAIYLCFVAVGWNRIDGDLYVVDWILSGTLVRTRGLLSGASAEPEIKQFKPETGGDPAVEIRGHGSSTSRSHLRRHQTESQPRTGPSGTEAERGGSTSQFDKNGACL